jgi:hypothetical protein
VLKTPPRSQKPPKTSTRRMRRKEKGKEKGKQKGKRQNEQQTNGAEMGFIDLGGGHHSWGVPFVSFQNHHVFF